MRQPSPLDSLAPSQRFMFEYGCFMAFWSNFDVVLDVAICRLTSRPPTDNCSALAGLTTGDKRRVLEKLIANDTSEKRDALAEVFAAVDRNGWVHGTVLNPRGDFTHLTRLRIKKDRSSGVVTVTNDPVNLAASPFRDFYPSYERFMHAFRITAHDCNDYICAIQGLKGGA